jgi:hypothetical protein
LGDLTHESVVNIYDNDGVMIDQSVVGLDEEDDDSEGAEQISITTTNGRCPHDQMLTDSQLPSKFKSVMNSHKSQSSKQMLWKLLTVAKLNQKRDHHLGYSWYYWPG